MCQKSKSKLMSIHFSAPMSSATVSPSPIKERISIPIPFSAMAPISNTNTNTNTNTNLERRQVRPRRVSFTKSEVVETIIEIPAIPLEDHHNIWYLAHELQSFKTQVRTESQEIRDNGLPTSNTSAAATTIYNSAEFPTRGLEHRICKNRQRNKALAIWGTLKAQKRSNDPEFIAMIARKCNYTATTLAYMEAARDYCVIYNPDEVASLSAQIESFASQSFPIKLKRKPSPSEANNNTNTNGRNVRTRIN